MLLEGKVALVNGTGPNIGVEIVRALAQEGATVACMGTGGAIVNVASTSGHRGGPGAIAYAAAKGGVLNLTRAMATQLAEYGIRVNSVTPTQTGVPVAGGKSRLDGPPPQNIPLGRWGKPRDQAEAVLFLASPKADYITGADLPVDGGLLAVFPTG